jgi:recombinational DNA repair protein (RecF pathway)
LKLNKFNPIDSSDSVNDILDQMFSGNYLISAINHSIDREKHQCHIQLIKDSFIMDLDSPKGQ